MHLADILHSLDEMILNI